MLKPIEKRQLLFFQTEAVFVDSCFQTGGNKHRGWVNFGEGMDGRKVERGLRVLHCGVFFRMFSADRNSW